MTVTCGVTVGLVGAGGIARAHLPAWIALGARVRVYSRSGTERLLAEHPGTFEVVESLEALLADCTVVDVCTPTPSHPEIVRAAAAAGKNVVCEKPLALTSSEAADLVTTCATAGVHLYPGHVVRFFPEYAAMREAVARGAIGQIAVQRFTRVGSHPVKPWFADDEQSGGIITDQSIHDLDFARWTAGEVATVYAQSTQADGELGVRSGQVVLTHMSGAISYVTGTWARSGSTFRTTFEIAGTDGILRHDSAEHPLLRVDGGAAADDGTGLFPATSGNESPFLTELGEFAAAFAGGASPRVTAADGVAAVRLAEAARESARTGQVIQLHHELAAAGEES